MHTCGRENAPGNHFAKENPLEFRINFLQCDISNYSCYCRQMRSSFCFLSHFFQRPWETQKRIIFRVVSFLKKSRRHVQKKWELIANGSAKTIISIKRVWVNWAWEAKEFPFHVMALFNHFLLLADLHSLLRYRFLPHAIIVVFTTTLFLTLYYENVHREFFFSEKEFTLLSMYLYGWKAQASLLNYYSNIYIHFRNISTRILSREYLRFVLSSRGNF